MKDRGRDKMKKFAGFILIGFGVLVLLFSIPSLFSLSKKSTEEKEFITSIQSLEGIDLASTSADWDVKTYDGEELVVQLKHPRGRANIDTQEKNNRMNVEVKRQGFRFFPFNFWLSSSTVTVFVPTDYENELTIKTVAGDIELTGEWNLTDVQVKTTSGDVRGMNLIGDNVNISSVSGDINVEQLDAERLVMNTTSGDLFAQELTGAIEGKTVSGDIWIEFKNENKETTLKTTSGDVGVHLPSGNADVTMKTTSGDIMAKLEFMQQSQNSHHVSGKIGNGDYPFTISTTSGDIFIN